MKNNIVIRLEEKSEYREVENLVRDSFWNVYRPGCLEHYALHQLRNDPAFVPELDFVMYQDEELIGQNIFVRTVISADDGRSIPIMTMGPICIKNEYKRKGFGKILLDYSLEKAAELGCIGTQFKNAHGLHDEGHYTTAYDMAIIAMNAWKSSETFRKVCSTVRYDVPPTNMCNETRYWLNNNRMIRQGEEYYYADCIGGKTGFTNEAGGTLVTFANLNGRQVVCVVLKSTNSASAYSDTIKLYDYIKANAVQTDYDVLDAKAAEEASIAAAQAESISNAQTTTAVQKESTVVQEKEKKNAKGFSVAGKVLLAAAIIIAVAYFYVSYRRYQARQRKLARRRQMDREKREHYYEQKRIDHELEKRKNKYRNYDFSDKNNRR